MNNTKLKQQLRRSFFALTIVGALFTLPNAKAGPPVPASGSSTNCQCLTDFRPVGGNLILTWDITQTFTGTFTGTWVGTERDVVFHNGSATFHGSGIFTGSVNGSQPGTIMLTYVGNAPGPVGGIAYWVVDQGTGGLASLHGHGTFGNLMETGPTDGGCDHGGCDDTFSNDYSGQIQFAP